MRTPRRRPSPCLPVTCFALLLLAACSTDSDAPVDFSCSLEGFKGGSYTLFLNTAKDTCTPGGLLAPLFRGTLGPASIPRGDELPAEVALSLPVIGNVTATLTADGNRMALAIEDPILLEDVNAPFIGHVDISVDVSGSICPVSESFIHGSLTLSLLSIDPETPLVNTPCDVRVEGVGLP